jgi:hypothetical protein
MLGSVSGCSSPSTVPFSPAGLSMHLFRLLVLALTPQHSCQVVLAPRCGCSLFAQHRLPQPKCLSICKYCAKVHSEDHVLVGNVKDDATPVLLVLVEMSRK